MSLNQEWSGIQDSLSNRRLSISVCFCACVITAFRLFGLLSGVLTGLGDFIVTVFDGIAKEDASGCGDFCFRVRSGAIVVFKIAIQIAI